MASGTELCNRFTKRDKALLQEIKSYCGVGKIYKPTQGSKNNSIKSAINKRLNSYN